MTEQSNLTTTEKIDYIFDYIKKEEKTNKIKTIIKWFFRLFILAYILYVYLYLWPIARDFYTQIFNNPLLNKTETSQTKEASWSSEIQIWSFKLSREKVEQIKTLFCK